MFASIGNITSIGYITSIGNITLILGQGLMKKNYIPQSFTLGGMGFPPRGPPDLRSGGPRGGKPIPPKVKLGSIYQSSPPWIIIR